MDIFLKFQISFFIFICILEIHRGKSYTHKLNSPTLLRLKLKSSFFKKMRKSICYRGIFNILPYSPFLTKVENFMSNTTPHKEVEAIPPMGCIYRRELAWYSHIFFVLFDVQIQRDYPLIKKGIFLYKEEVLSGGSVSNAFNFPLEVNTPLIFLSFNLKEIV